MNKPTLKEFAKTALYIGLTGYGGPAVLGHMKKQLVHKKNGLAKRNL